MSGERPPGLRRIWMRNTLIVGALALLAMVALDGPRLKLAVLGAAWLQVWNTVTVIRAWLFLTRYRWFWWWR